MVTFPFSTPALRIEQPIGRFYVVALPADLLLQVAVSDVITATLNVDGDSYTLEGNQRVIKDERLVQIGEYIDRSDSAFPNSIILAANLSSEDGFSIDDDIEDDGNGAGEPHSLSWRIEEQPNGFSRLVIPTSARLASIIDGQHRLFAFAKAKVSSRRNMQLACAVFLDLPRPLQAQIFGIYSGGIRRLSSVAARVSGRPPLPSDGLAASLS